MTITNKLIMSDFKEEFKASQKLNNLFNTVKNSRIVEITKKTLITVKNKVIEFADSNNLLVIITAYILAITLIYSIFTGSLKTGLLVTMATIIYIIIEFLAVYIFTVTIVGSVKLYSKIANKIKRSVKND